MRAFLAAKLVAPGAAVVTMTVIARTDPVGASVGPMTPVAAVPCVACSDGRVITTDPGVVRTGSGRGICDCGWRGRGRGDVIRGGGGDTDAKVEMGSGEHACSGKQEEYSEFGFHNVPPSLLLLVTASFRSRLGNAGCKGCAIR